MIITNALRQSLLLFAEEEFPLNSKNPLAVIARGADRELFGKKNLPEVFLSGVKIVIAESFDSFWRADLISSGILPLLFKFGMSRESLLMEGGENLNFLHLSARMRPGMDILCQMKRKTGVAEEFVLACDIQTQQELACFLK